MSLITGCPGSTKAGGRAPGSGYVTPVALPDDNTPNRSVISFKKQPKTKISDANSTKRSPEKLRRPVF
ncbi:hypothetical protein [Pseudomonas sp. KU43P]|uniref:hypothetical protein n=1 Tax=Pseudomonas sp. KU43P TaxID=2487887 RepID=UPI0039880753